jgi:hypothetical protein
MRVGDTIVIEPKKALQPGRTGVIEEVINEDPARLLIRWEDGHTSILSPAAGVARITPAKAKPRAASKPRAAKAKPRSTSSAGRRRTS